MFMLFDKLEEFNRRIMIVLRNSEPKGSYKEKTLIEKYIKNNLIN